VLIRLAALTVILGPTLVPAQTPTPAEQPTAPAAQQETAQQASPPPALSPEDQEKLERVKTSFKKGDYQAALDTAKEILAVQSTDLTSLYIAGVSALRLKRLDEADGYLNTLYKTEPAMPNVLFHLGHLAFVRAEVAAKEGRSDDAKALYEEAATKFDAEIARDPKQMQAMASRPIAYARAGKVDEAIKAYEAWIAAASEPTAALVGLGSYYAELGRTADALAVVDRLPKANPKVVGDAAYGMARWLYVNEKYEDSLKLIDKVFEFDPESKSAHGLKAVDLARLNRFNESAAELCRYMARDPQPEEASNVGEVFKKQFGEWAVGRGGPPPAAQGQTLPSARKRAVPTYPDQARRERIETQVIVVVRVKPDGTAADTCLVPTPGWQSIKSLGMDQAAVEAAKRWKFDPATKDGAPVEGYFPASVVFSLR
jgi:TonB family protein